MRHVIHQALLSTAIAAALAASHSAAAQDRSGAVEQSIPPAVSQNPVLPPLHLSDAERAKIRDAACPSSQTP